VARVCVRQLFDASVHEVETCWYDVNRWPEWVDGLARVISVDGGWPRVGSEVIWQSSPAGRGRVSERVEAYEPLRGLTVRVQDEAIEGHQQVRFEPAGSGVEVELSLDYRITRRTPVTPVIEWLFVRRPMTTSLTRTLERFGSVLG
jgi:Polyketide cyclase / dehydrase and lipid transport